jgi:hypothetical protein
MPATWGSPRLAGADFGSAMDWVVAGSGVVWADVPVWGDVSDGAGADEAAA